MNLHWFTILALDPAAGQEALNHHLTTTRVSHVDKVFVADGANSYWSVCVSAVDGTASSAKAGDNARRGKSIDYCEVLAPDEFGLYDRLRMLRKGNCSFPRAGGRLGWGSNAGTAPAKFRPPPQPVLQTAPSQRLGPAAGVLGPQDPSASGRSPRPGAGARTSVARTLGVSRIFTMRNALFLMRHAEAPPGPPLSWLGPHQICSRARQ